MVFFKKKPEPEGKSADSREAEALKFLLIRKDQDLRELGEIYYTSGIKGRLDTRGLARKVKELQRLDQRIEALQASGKVPAAAAAAPRGALRPKPCVHCGAPLTLNDRFCAQCGRQTAIQAAPAKQCPACNRNVDAAARFCNYCGADTLQPGRLKVRHPFTGQEVSFDFQPGAPQMPGGGGLASPSTSQDGEPSLEEALAAADFAEPAPPDDRAQWVRDLERFARPSQVDVSSFLSRGREFLQVGRYREAAAEFEAVILANPRDGRALYHLGVARYKNGELEAALDAFERSARLDRTNPDAHNDLGLCYIKKGKWREAVEHYQEALHIAPSHSDAHYNLAQLHIQQVNYSEAIKHLQLYLQYSPRARDFKRVTEMIERLHAASMSGVPMAPDALLPQR